MSIGQYGSVLPSEYAAQAIVAAWSSWHQPSATRGRRASRAIMEPTVLPIPSPARKTDRISEKVYTVPPSISDSRRVQMTSEDSAHSPERPRVTYTAQARAAPARSGTTVATVSTAR
jgi:hypothetical protein